MINFGDARLPDRFWSKVAPCPMSGCWLWMAGGDGRGYGAFRMGPGLGRHRNSMSKAHRVAYVAMVGDVPAGLELDHLCRVRCCVNPAHLEPVTHSVNVKRGEAPAAGAAFNKAKKCCPRGHPYSGENLYLCPTGKRDCHTCRRAADQRRRDRNTAKGALS